MVRLRFLRILLPALLVPFLLLLAFTFRQRPPALSHQSAPGESAERRAEGIEMTELWTGGRRLFMRAGLGEMDDEGRVRLERVERVEVDRDHDSPLIVSADHGKVDGKPGQRTMTLEGGVHVQDAEGGVRVSLPALEIDEATSTARSVGPVSFADSGYEGTADHVVYGLRKDQPTLLTAPDVHGTDGSSLKAGMATVREDRLRMDLEQDVEIMQGPTRLRSERAFVTRDEQGRLRSATATGKVRCSGLSVAGMASELTAESFQVDWDALGHPTHALAEGDPVAQRGGQTLRARTITLARAEDGGWDLTASGGARASGLFEEAPALLSAEELRAAIDPRGNLVHAEALRGARFEGNEARGQAASARFVPSSEAGGEVTLVSGPGEPARLARGRTRVTARTITTDARGIHLVADQKVEATLLDATKDPKKRRTTLFDATEAIHFVADHLVGEVAQGRYSFHGSVRGWQGERNLAGDEVEIDQHNDTLFARTHVTSRFPREAATAKAEDDYVQVSADTLDYTGANRRAVYEGGARVRVAEGWLEGTRIEAVLDDAGKQIQEMIVEGKVRFEMRPGPHAGSDQGPVRGKGDRVVYTPGSQLVRLIGIEAPASVTRDGPQGSTTMGRVLRYRLDEGTLEVESQDRSGVDAGRNLGR